MRPASSAPNGGTRKVTSRSTSTNTPPSPTITTGPNSGSCETPTTVSTPPLTVSHTSTPSTRARFPPARRALRMSSSCTVRTSRADPTPTRTRPRSLLCVRSGDDTFITTG